ncbi:MAG: hypothetical protein RL208_558, partial [Pseudomonadota bacterium]
KNNNPNIKTKEEIRKIVVELIPDRNKRFQDKITEIFFNLNNTTKPKEEVHYK